MRLIPQTDAMKMAARLNAEFADSDCLAADVAVAWLRTSGLALLQTGLIAHLERGGAFTLVVGLDGDNTSEEGLRGLLTVCERAVDPASVRLFVRHNEDRQLFHPKMYAFRGASLLKVYAGSNNFTGSGLSINEELSAFASESLGGDLEADLNTYMALLTDASSGLVKPLDEAFVDALRDHGYIKPERMLRPLDGAGKLSQSRKNPLFARKRAKQFETPRPGAPIQVVAGLPDVEIQVDWSAVYLRLRLSRGGTQGQVPARVVGEIRRRIGLDPQEKGVLELVNQRSGVVQTIRPAGPGPRANTYKFEAKSVVGEPLLRIFPVGGKIFYEFFDSKDPLGVQVMKMLEEGFDSDPPRTFQTISDRASATWYLFD